MDPMVLNPEVEVSEPEDQPGGERGVRERPSGGLTLVSPPVVQDFGSLLAVKGLRVQDVLELVHPLRGVLHMSRQVAVEEAERVAVEGQTDRQAPFVTLRDQDGSVTPTPRWNGPNVQEGEGSNTMLSSPSNGRCPCACT